MTETHKMAPSEHSNLRPEPAVAAADRSPPDGNEVLLKRVAEYELQGLEKSQGFESLMAAVQADLFRVASLLEADANQALVGCTTVDSICEAETITSPYFCVTRKIARNAQLELRARRVGLDKRSAAQQKGQ
jgi:hypothetical protein